MLPLPPGVTSTTTCAVPCCVVLCCALQSFTEDGSVIWESKDILLDLERRFPQSVPLLPTNEEEQQAAMDFMAELEECGMDKHGGCVGTHGKSKGCEIHIHPPRGSG
jgi:hypothetical protein